MLIDTHCHLFECDYDNLDEVINDVLKSDVRIIILNGYDAKSSNEAILLANKYKNVYATVGFDPHESKSIKEDDYRLFDDWLSNEKVVGIGEIGLDYYYDIEGKEKQKDVFEKQVDIAVKYNKPIIVHNRDASEDMYNILKNKKAKGIIHCFSENIEWARKFINLGFFLGIGGIITFKKNNIIDVISEISLEYIVLETDSPYLSPEPLRGKKNSPINLPLVANKIAEIKEVTYSKVAAKTTENALQLFDLNRDL